MTATPTWFESAYRQEFAFVWRTLRTFSCSDTRADDLAHDVFLILYQRGELPSTQLRGFLFLTARNLFRNAQRSERHTVASPLEDSGEHPLTHQSPERATQWNQELRLLQDWLSELPEDERDAFVLLELEGMDAQTAAELLGTNTNTLYGRARRARETLTRRWQRNAGTESEYAVV